jgi:hypothetical protein
MKCIIHQMKILCGDFNVNYLHDNAASFNMYSTINFLQESLIIFCTLLYNIYISSYLYEHLMCPLINGVSDHGVIVLSNTSELDHKQVFYHKRVINNNTIGQFICSLAVKIGKMFFFFPLKWM